MIHTHTRPTADRQQTLPGFTAGPRTETDCPLCGGPTEMSGPVPVEFGLYFCKPCDQFFRTLQSRDRGQ